MDGRSFCYLSYEPDRISPPQKKIIAAAKSFICSDHVRAEQEHRLDGVLLEQGPQVLQEQPHCGEEPLDADLRHRERSERLVTEQHRSRVGWDDVPRIPFYKKKSTENKVINDESRERALGAVEFERGTPISEKQSDVGCLRPNK